MNLKNVEIINNLIYLIITVIILILFLSCLFKINKNSEKFINNYPFDEQNLFKGHKPCKKCKRPGNSCSLTRH